MAPGSGSPRGGPMECRGGDAAAGNRRRTDYLRRPRRSISLWYRSASSLRRYSSSRRRRPTIWSSPRREWWSFAFDWKCSVRYAMRLVSSATWTSGEPVSVSCVRNCLTMSAFPDSYSVTFTLPPNDSNYSLFLISREDYHTRGWACQPGSPPGVRDLPQNDPGLDHRHA